MIFLQLFENVTLFKKTSIKLVMARKKNLSTGRGATVTCLKRMLHPSKTISEKHVNYTNKCKLGNLIVTREEMKKIKNTEKKCMVHHHEDFPNVELHSVSRWAAVTKEGPESEFFVRESEEGNDNEEKEEEENEEEDVQVTGDV